MAAKIKIATATQPSSRTSKKKSASKRTSSNTARKRNLKSVDLDQKLKAVHASSKRTGKRKLKVPTEQWALPVSMDTEGHFVSMRDTCAGKTAVLSFAQLSLNQQTELVARRIEQQPKFELSMIGAGVVSKERAIAEVRAQTPVGRTLIEIEQRMMARMMKRAKQERD